MSGPYVGKWTAGEGEMDGECTSVTHFHNRQKPKATHYDKGQHRWVCFTCAQNRNRELMQISQKLGGAVDTKKSGCVSARDRMLEILMS